MLIFLVIFLISPLETRHFFLSLSLFFKAQSKMGCSTSTLFKGKDEEKAPCDREQEPSEISLATATRRRKGSETAATSRQSYNEFLASYPKKVTRKVSLIKESKDIKIINKKYRKVKRLGEGSFGRVMHYRYDGGDDNATDCAIKIYDKKRLQRIRSSNNERTALDDAFNEAQILVQLEHENVTQLIEFLWDEESPKLYFVLEYCALGPILDEKRETFEKIDWRTCIRYAHDVFWGVTYIHEVFVVHLDIKPQNMFVNANGSVKLGDFGTAVILSKDTHTVLKTPGTPAFTAPECCEGQPYNGFKADAWSVGMSFHAMCTGSYHYKTGSSYDTYMRILHEESTDDSLLSSLFQETDKDENEYSEQFATVLSSLLVRDPKSRCGVAEAKDMFLDRAFSGVT